MAWFDFGRLFGREIKDPGEAAEAAEQAEASIERRLARVAEQLKKGGYKKLADDELRLIREDIEKILEFVDHAITIIEYRREMDPSESLRRRIRYVKTRITKILDERKDPEDKKGVA